MLPKPSEYKCVNSAFIALVFKHFSNGNSTALYFCIEHKTVLKSTMVNHEFSEEIKHDFSNEKK